MLSTMHDMQQEINNLLEESDLLASNIANQQIALADCSAGGHRCHL